MFEPNYKSLSGSQKGRCRNGTTYERYELRYANVTVPFVSTGDGWLEARPGVLDQKRGDRKGVARPGVLFDFEFSEVDRAEFWVGKELIETVNGEDVPIVRTLWGVNAFPFSLSYLGIKESKDILIRVKGKPGKKVHTMRYTIDYNTKPCHKQERAFPVTRVKIREGTTRTDLSWENVQAVFAPWRTRLVLKNAEDDIRVLHPERGPDVPRNVFDVRDAVKSGFVYAYEKDMYVVSKVSIRSKKNTPSEKKVVHRDRVPLWSQLTFPVRLAIRSMQGKVRQEPRSR